jgi:hypothetical protein
MDDFGNIIYLVILIISFIAGIWRKNNKEAETPPSAPPKSELEEMMGPVFKQFERKWTKVELSHVQMEEQQSTAHLRDLERRAMEAKQARGVRRKRSEAMSLKEETYQLPTNDALDLSDFDARKAIIYSEILNPPYL